MGFDLGHTISSLAKLALRTKQNIDKQSNEGKKIKLYQLWTDRTYRAFETKEKTGYKAFMFRGQPIENWESVELHPSNHNTETGKEIGDVYSIDVSSVVVNEKCFNVISSHLQGNVQILPAQSESQRLYVLNVTTIIDCLDRKNSKLKLFQSSGRIMRVEEYAFHRELLDNVFIFKIPEELHTHPYVTEDFKKLIEQNNIKGFKFVPVWEEK